MLDLLFPQIFLGHSQRRLFAKGIPVLVWHSIAKPPAGARDPFLYTPPERFDRQLAALREAGYSPATLADISQATDNRDQKVVITFNDGCRNVFENALPILGRHKFTAIQFIVAGLIGGKNEWDVKHGDVAEALMDAAQIREWIAAGHEIGSHSMTHRNLNKPGEAAAREQIFDSKKRLEDLCATPIRHFCYPHGKWNENVRALVAQAGYATACTMDFGVNTRENDCHGLRRIAAISEADLIAKVAHRVVRKVKAGHTF